MYLLYRVRASINNNAILRNIFVKIISPFTVPVLSLFDILSLKKFKRQKKYLNWKKNNPDQIYKLKNNLKIKISDSKLSSSKSLIIQNGKYEQNETFLFKKIIKEGWNILDIGANFGWYSLHFSKMVGNNGNVYAFEPIEQTYDELKSNLSLNNATNVKTFKFALLIESSFIRFQIFLLKPIGPPCKAWGPADASLSSENELPLSAKRPFLILPA